MRYEILDHTADLLIKASGKSLEECYCNICYGMFDSMVRLEDVRPLEETVVDVTGIDDQDALYSMLSELLLIADADGTVFCEFEIQIDGTHVVCKARGEQLDKSRMRTGTEIKAVTYHDMIIDKEKNQVTVLFDV